MHNNNNDGINQQRLKAEQFSQWLGTLPVLNILEPLCGAMLVWLYWERHPQSELIGWFAALLFFVFLRGAAAQLYHQLVGSSRSLDIRHWRLLFLLITLVNSALFAVAVVHFNPANTLFSPEPLITQILMAATVVGLLLVALVCHSIYLPAMVSGLLIIALPAMLHVIRSGIEDAHWMVAILAVVSACLLLAGREINRRSLNNIALQQRNLGLIEYLENARLDAESLNDKLSREIYERKLARQHLLEANDRLESIVTERTRSLEQTNTELAATSQRLQLALEASNVGLWDWNLESQDAYHSNFDRILGYDRERFTGFLPDLQHLTHPDDWPKVKAAMVAHFKKQTEYYHIIYRLRHADGSWRWIEDKGQVVKWDSNHRAIRMIGTRRDITEQKQAVDQTRLAATVFENASEGILIFDTDFRFMTVNDCFSRISGYSQEELVGKTIPEVSGSMDINRAVYANVAETVMKEGFWQGEATERRKSGETYPAWVQISAVYNEQGEVTHYVGLFSDLTARKSAEEKVQFLSNFDRLTGLGNRSLFRERLQRALSIARLKRERVALLSLDLDRFRTINDSLGHEIGDKLLRACSDRFQNLDIDNELLARIGGDEFSLIVENVTDMKRVEQLAQDIINTIRRPFNINGHELLLGVSIGISVFPDNAKELQALINQADLAVHQAKRLGGNTFQFYHSQMRAASVEQLALETSLRKAITQNEFEVYFQPKLSIATRTISSAEALVRWQHPTMGLLSPKDFIPLAEETGLISAISEWVLDRACRYAKEWQNEGRAIPVSVNLSAHQFRKGDIVENVQDVLKRHQLPPHLLELELTESAIMEDMDKNVQILEELRTMGVTLSLDDFGTGYSSLSYLKFFPVDTLKIDRAFISELGSNDNDAAITRAIIDMAHSMKMHVVAEGVERESQLLVLQGMGCDTIQGYLISRPVPEPDFIKLVQAQQRPLSLH